MSIAPRQHEFHEGGQFLVLAAFLFFIFTTALSILLPWLAVRLGLLPEVGMSWTKIYFTPHLPDLVARMVEQVTPLPDPEIAGLAVKRYPIIHYIIGAAPAVGLVAALLISRLATRPLAGADGVRHLSGGRYFSAPREASRRLKKITKAETAGVRDQGIKIGGVQISRERETSHFVVVGNTGGGKTVAIKPMIRGAIRAGDRLVVFDNKGDFTRWVPGRGGAEPILLAPWDSRGAAWAVGRDINTPALAVEYAARLVPEPTEGNPMWTNAARMVLAGLIKKLQAERGEDWSFPDLRDLLTLSVEETTEVMQTYHPEGLRAVQSLSVSGGPSRTTESILISLASFMGPVYRLAEAWGDPQKTISIREFMDEEGGVLIIQGSGQFSQLAGITANSLFSLILQIINSPSYPERRPEEPGTWLFMDEFVQAGKIEDFERFLEIGRSKGVRVVLGSQNLTQIQKAYDEKTASTIIGQAKSYILATLADPESREFFSKMIGSREIERVRVNMSHDIVTRANTRSTSAQHETIPVIRDHEFSVGTGKHFDYPKFLRKLFPSLNKYGGCHSIVWMKSAGSESDAYKLDFRFKEAAMPELREAHVPADWTSAEWATGDAAMMKRAREMETRKKEVVARLADKQQQQILVDLYVAAGGDKERIQKVIEEGLDLGSDEFIFKILSGLMTGPMAELLDAIHTLAEAKSGLEILSKGRPTRIEKRRVPLQQGPVA